MSFSAGEGEVGLPVLVVESSRDVSGLSVASGTTSLPCLQDVRYVSTYIRTYVNPYVYAHSGIGQ